MKKVPKHIASQYEDGSHGFRKEKRSQVRELKRILDKLRLGCAYFPCGEGPIEIIENQMNVILDAVSVKHWGK